MALKFKFAARDDIPEEQRALYVGRNGVWLLDVEGAVEKAKLDEFRANNTAWLRQLDEHQQRFEGIDPLEEWVDLQAADAPHLFETNAGSGAAGNTSGGGAQRSVKNPFRKESWNLTEQMRLLKKDHWKRSIPVADVCQSGSRGGIGRI